MMLVSVNKTLAQLLVVCYLLLTATANVLEAEGNSLPDKVLKVATTIADVEGAVQSPFLVEQAKASVLIFVTHDCPISNAYSPELSRLRNEYGTKGFNMMLVYVDPDVSDEGIQSHMKDFKLTGFTAIPDREHQLVKAVGATVTPEVAVILPDGSISYRGRIDNMYPALGQRRRVITEKELRDALDAIGANQPVKVSRTQAVGCYVPNLKF